MMTKASDKDIALKPLLIVVLVCCLTFLIVASALAATDDKVIFLHHSTGEGVWGGGIGAPTWFSNYNTAHGTAYDVDERSYPNSPYPWANYPYDYWHLWINGECNSANPNIECMPKLTTDYDIIIYKHCYPGAGVVADNGDPDITSSVKTLANYKLQYRALRQLMDSYPNNKFIVWTLAPLHRLATTSANAARAKEFVDWVKYDFLVEDNQNHPNIFIFDFFGFTAGTDNFLRYEYEGSHSSSDSHPNSLANSTVMPLFSQFIVDTADCGHDPARIERTAVEYESITAACVASQNNDTIQLVAGNFSGPLELANPLPVNLQGGLGCDYSFNQGYSTISGPVTITGGTVKLDRIIIN
jgi:hypothetical protein